MTGNITKKIIRITVPVILVIFIGLGVFISNYLNDVRFYKPIKFVLPEEANHTGSFRPFGITPGGRVLPFPVYNNQLFIHGYAFFKKVGVVTSGKELSETGNIRLSIGEQSFTYSPVALKNSWQVIRGEKIGIKDNIVLLMPASLYTKDSKFIILFSAIHWSVVQKMLLVLLILLLILLSVFFIKKRIRYMLRFKVHAISTISFILKEASQYALILFIQLLFFVFILFIISYFFNSFLLMLFLKRNLFLYTLLLIFISASLIIGFAFILMKKLHFAKQKINNILLLNGTLVFILCIAEFILKTAGIHNTYTEKYSGSYQSSYKQWDNTWYKVHNFNSVNYLRVSEFTHIRKTNSLGLSDVEHPVNKDANEFRIIGLGDSFTEGDGAHTDSTWLKFLEYYIKGKSSKTFSFMNAGIIDSDPFFGYVLLRDKLIKYHPDLVILSINFSDIYDVIVRGGMERFKPDGRLKYHEGPSWEWLFASSRIFRLFIQTVFQYNTYLMSSEEYNRASLASIDRLKQSLLLFRALAGINHFKLLVTIHPSHEEVDAGKYKYLSGLFKFAVDNRIPCFDMLKYFIDKEHINQTNSGDYYWKTDPHHNARGYAAYARGVEWKLRQMGIVDSSDCLKHD